MVLSVAPGVTIVLVTVRIWFACAAVRSPHGFFSNLATSSGLLTVGAARAVLLVPVGESGAENPGDAVPLPVVEFEHADSVSPASRMAASAAFRVTSAARA